MKNQISLVSLLLMLAFTKLNSQTQSSRIIPVSIVYEEGIAKLQWTTFKEVNSSYFLIESSKDNFNFECVARVKAKGYSQIKSNYELDNLNDVSTKEFFRVSLITMDGERLNSLVLNVSGISTPSSLAHN